MVDAKKFLFDTHDFDDEKPKAAPAIYTEEQLRLALEQGTAQGRADGLRDAQAQQEARIAELLDKALQQCALLAQNEDARAAKQSAEAVTLALRIMRKLMPQFASQFSLGEIEATILQAVETRKDEPRIAVMVPTLHLDALKDRMDKLALEKGYTGRVILIADDTLPPTDCRVEWADGGMDRLYDQLFAVIEEKLKAAAATIKTTT